MIRQLIVARADDFFFLELKKKEDPEGLFIQVARKLSELLGGFDKLDVLGVPSLDWEVQLTKDLPEKQKLPSPDRIVISLHVNDLQSLDEFRKAVEEANDRRSDTPPFPGVGADLSLAESEYFCPTNVD